MILISNNKTYTSLSACLSVYLEYANNSLSSPIIIIVFESLSLLWNIPLSNLKVSIFEFAYETNFVELCYLLMPPERK